MLDSFIFILLLYPVRERCGLFYSTRLGFRADAFLQKLIQATISHKRQIEDQANPLTDRRKQAQSQAFAKETECQRRDPVSYTHLDVYKRQQFP